MHVNTRENRRWTWQTFWWSENPDTPQSPSSKLIADLRPKSLDRAAKHYAMGVAYNMISPTQPYTKGTNAVTTGEPIKQSIYAYNPYLEAGFSALCLMIHHHQLQKRLGKILEEMIPFENITVRVIKK